MKKYYKELNEEEIIKLYEHEFEKVFINTLLEMKRPKYLTRYQIRGKMLRQRRSPKIRRSRTKKQIEINQKKEFLDYMKNFMELKKDKDLEYTNHLVYYPNTDTNNQLEITIDDVNRTNRKALKTKNNLEEDFIQDLTIRENDNNTLEKLEELLIEDEIDSKYMKINKLESQYKNILKKEGSNEKKKKQGQQEGVKEMIKRMLNGHKPKKMDKKTSSENQIDITSIIGIIDDEEMANQNHEL